MTGANPAEWLTLGRLEQRDHGPGPLLARVGEPLRGAQQAGDVHVVAAGVRHRHLRPPGSVAVTVLAYGSPGRLTHG